jgi:type IV secretory pathway VirB2 component (pilin)
MTASKEIVMHKLIQNKGKLSILGLLACLFAFPDFALASGGISEFSSPLEQVVNTITGPAGKWISIVAMALCGVIFIMNNDEYNTFILPNKSYFIKNNQIITRKFSPVFIHLNLAKSQLGAGRLAGIFLLSLPSG